MLVLRNYEEVERLQKTLKLDMSPLTDAQATAKPQAPSTSKQRGTSIKLKDTRMNTQTRGQGQILCPVFPGDLESIKAKPARVVREAVRPGPRRSTGPQTKAEPLAS